MKNKITDIYDQITPDLHAQVRVKHKINFKLKEKSQMTKKTFIKTAVALAGAAAIFAVCVIGIPMLTKSDRPAGNAFSITAYAAGNEQIGYSAFDDLSMEIKLLTAEETGDIRDLKSSREVITLEFNGDNLETVDIEMPDGMKMTLNMDLVGNTMGVSFPEGSEVGAVIKTTATYKDGTTETNDIVLGTK